MRRPRSVIPAAGLILPPVRFPDPPHPALARVVADLIRPPVRKPEAGSEPASEVEGDTPRGASGSS